MAPLLGVRAGPPCATSWSATAPACRRRRKRSAPSARCSSSASIHWWSPDRRASPRAASATPEPSSAGEPIGRSRACRWSGGAAQPEVVVICGFEPPQRPPRHPGLPRARVETLRSTALLHPGRASPKASTTWSRAARKALPVRRSRGGARRDRLARARAAGRRRGRGGPLAGRRHPVLGRRAPRVEPDATVLFRLRIPESCSPPSSGPGSPSRASHCRLSCAIRSPNPFVFGLSGGAAIGAALSVAITGTTLGAAGFSAADGSACLPTQFAAVLGSLAAAVLVFTLGRARGRLHPERALLVGVVFTPSLGPGHRARGGARAREDPAVPALARRTLGYEPSPSSSPPAPWLLVGGRHPHRARRTPEPPRPRRRRRRRAGRRRGVDAALVILAASAAVGAAVALTGLVGFVGLCAARVRLVAGPTTGWCCPASALGGAAFLVWRTHLPRLFRGLGTEPPVGAVTALLARLSSSCSAEAHLTAPLLAIDSVRYSTRARAEAGRRRLAAGRIPARWWPHRAQRRRQEHLGAIACGCSAPRPVRCGWRGDDAFGLPRREPRPPVCLPLPGRAGRPSFTAREVAPDGPRAASRAGGRSRRRRSRARRRARRKRTRSTWPTAPWRNCPAASASASSSPAPSRRTPRSSCSTSRPPRSTWGIRYCW